MPRQNKEGKHKSESPRTGNLSSYLTANVFEISGQRFRAVISEQWRRRLRFDGLRFLGSALRGLVVSIKCKICALLAPVACVRLYVCNESLCVRCVKRRVVVGGDGTLSYVPCKNGFALIQSFLVEAAAAWFEIVSSHRVRVDVTLSMIA